SADGATGTTVVRRLPRSSAGEARAGGLEGCLVIGLHSSVNAFVQAVIFFQPLGQGEDLVGRSHLEARRTTVLLVRVVVDRGGRDVVVFQRAVVLVLGHGQHSAGSW